MERHYLGSHTPMTKRLRPVLRLPLIALLLSAAAGSDAAHAQTPAADCDDPGRCTQLALEARSRGAYETFHDLAWRAVQHGPPNDPDLMYLLARAQALSGRRRDALVMLRRLAEAGIPNDAGMHEDFRRVRELPEWNFVRTLADRARPAPPQVVDESAPAAPVASAPATPERVAAAPERVAVEPAPSAALPERVTPPAARAAAAETAAPPVPEVAPSAAAPVSAAANRPAPRIERAVVDDAVRFSTGAFAPAGLAYDAVSRRFLFGDMAGRRLFVVGEGGDSTVDLVRAASAGFEDVTALAIDRTRGDLWVLSSASGSTAGAIHRLQLISGRAVATIPVANPNAAVRLIDVVVAADGLVAALDSGAPRLLLVRAGDTAIHSTIRLAVDDPRGVAVNDAARIVYVAHREGILRVDLAGRTTARLGAATGVDLTKIEQIRWYRDNLFAVQVQEDGQRWLVRLELGRGNRVTRTGLLEQLPASGGTFMTISGDELYYFVADSSGSPPPSTTDVVVRRIRLRQDGDPASR